MTTTVKAGDTYDVTFTVSDDDGAAVDLASVNTHRTIARLSGDPNATAVILASSVSDAPNGKITHALTGTLPPGTYDVEIELTTFTNVKSTVPSDSYFTLVVLPDLD
jgi:hypothetical protein